MQFIVKSQKMTRHGPCDRVDSRRLINMGTGVEQRPWTPTVRRGKIAAETSSPGPACVQLPPLTGTKVNDSKKLAAPAFTFGHKHHSRDQTHGPGPAQYNVTGLGAKGKETSPAATLQSRPRETTKFQTPAPGEYNVERGAKAVISAPPKYTFGQKPPVKKSQLTPAPNVYKIPTVLGVSKEGPIRSAPAFSITGRDKPRVIPSLQLPGPGAYDAELDAVKKKTPMYSMGIKYKYPSDDKPGPGNYCPEKYIHSKSVPAPSFAILHSPYEYLKKPILIKDKEICVIKHVFGDMVEN